MPATIENPPSAVAELETVLAAMIQIHEQMLGVARDHRAAISRADGAGVQACVGQQAVLAARVIDLDSQRKRLIAVIAPGLPSTTLTALAATLPEPARAGVQALAAKLRDVLLSLQRENRVIRTATHALIAHMDGLIQQVARALSHARLYGPQGRIDPGGPAPCGLDLTH